MMKIAFLGAGSFGTALTRAVARSGHQITVYDRKIEIVDEINHFHTNKKYLPELILPPAVEAVHELASAVTGKDLIVFSVPSSAIREMAEKIKHHLTGTEIIVSIAKGVDPQTLKPLSEVIEEILNIEPVILSGPSHAEEVAKDLPTTLVAASKNEIAMKKVQEVFASSTLRVYRNSDLKGVEIGGAVKNIIALAAGISDGIGYGDNSKAALMTRGMAEIVRIGMKMGADKETFYGLTGMGDLIVTCTSMHSRNRRCGILIGQGKSMEDATKQIGMVVEGIKATRSFHDIAKKMNVEMPITEAVYSVLFLEVDPMDAVDNLMLRELKKE